MSDIVPVIDGQIVLDLDQLAVAIRGEHEACEAAMTATVRHAIRAGDLLIDAKAQVRHGEWIGWLAENFDGHRNLASSYMRLAANAQRVVHLDSVRQAIAELAMPREVLPELDATPEVTDRDQRCVQHEDFENDLRRMVVWGDWRREEEEVFDARLAFVTGCIQLYQLKKAGAPADFGYATAEEYADARLSDIINALTGLQYEMEALDARARRSS
jgi:hypothetical protein